MDSRRRSCEQLVVSVQRKRIQNESASIPADRFQEGLSFSQPLLPLSKVPDGECAGEHDDVDAAGDCQRLQLRYALGATDRPVGLCVGAASKAAPRGADGRSGDEEKCRRELHLVSTARTGEKKSIRTNGGSIDIGADGRTQMLTNARSLWASFFHQRESTHARTLPRNCRASNSIRSCYLW